MSRNIHDLDPKMLPIAEAFIAALRAASIPHCVTSTLRTRDEQAALYAQGRDGLDMVNAKRIRAGLALIGPRDNAYTVTNADGGKNKSNHQGGFALDLVPVVNGDPVWPGAEDPRWQRIAAIGEAVGLAWGGRWTKFPDLPHWELPEEMRV